MKDFHKILLSERCHGETFKPHNIPYFSVYKTILLFKIFRLKIEGRLIHGSKLKREQKQVEGKAGIKVILQRFYPFAPTLAKPHLDF